MVMSRIKWTEKKIALLQAEGRGRGTGADYLPWLEVTSISSLGRSRRVWSPKTGRTHHLLSDVEYGLFLALEWSRDVVDIREQYPLDRDVTQEVARQLGIRHPFFAGTSVPTVLTVDFMATRIRDGVEVEEAFNAKRTEEAEDQRSLLKLEIQRAALALLEVPHHVVFHTDIPQQKVKNIAWIRDSLVKDGEAEPRPGYWASTAARLLSELAGLTAGTGSISLAGFCSGFDARHGAESGTGLRAARMLMHERLLKADLNQPALEGIAIGDFVVAPTADRLHSVGGR